jgi:hypothetical protein
MTFLDNHSLYAKLPLSIHFADYAVSVILLAVSTGYGACIITHRKPFW